MAGEWKKVQLDEIATISSGKRPAKVSKQPTEECTVPVIGGGGVSGYTNRALFEEGALITGRVGTLGKLFAPFYPCWPSDNTLVIHISETNVDGTYLRYAVELSIPQVAAMNRGAANPLITQGDIGRLNIPLPPLPEQRAIAHILGTLDDKIELNRRMNETLEAVAQALFKSWFVDFDPVVVNALKAGNPIPEKFAESAAHYRDNSDALGLPEHLLRLFPDRFMDSELWPIPEGWEVKQLGALLSDLVSGSRPRGGAISEGVPSIGAENILGIGRYDYSKEKFIPESHYQKMVKKGADVRPGDVLLYKDGAQIGRKTYFDCSFPHARCAVNEHVFILRSSRKTMQRFIYFWLDLPWTTEKIIALNTNSAQPGINKNGVYSLPILFPGDEIIHLFDKSITPLTNRIFSNSIESRILAALRNTLLPKLISGELRVPDVEKILERV